MSGSPETAQISTRLVILDVHADRVLLVRDGEGWTLPVVGTRGHWYAEVMPIVDAVHDAYGVNVTALRTIRAKKIEGVTHVLWVMQADQETSPQDGIEWRAVDDLLGIDADEGERVAIDSWMEASQPRTPWLRPGWRSEALGWAQHVLAAHGRSVTGAPQQFRHWSITSLWRIPSDRGEAWFKAVLPLFAHEGTLIQLLASSMPDHLPRVLGTDRDRGWMLMESLPAGAPGDRLQWEIEAGLQHDEPLRVLARLQQAWIGREEALLAAGCADRRLATLPRALEELLASDMVRNGLIEDECARLAAFAEEIPGRVEALRACGVPETLMHGDFHPGNIAAADGAVVIYDWTDGCVGHPFFDLPTFLPRDPIERAALLEAYLGEWRAFAPADHVERAWELAEPLACIHHALSYKRILEAVEPTLRSEFDTDVTFWLRWLRDLLDSQ